MGKLGLRGHGFLLSFTQSYTFLTWRKDDHKKVTIFLNNNFTLKATNLKSLINILSPHSNSVVVQFSVVGFMVLYLVPHFCPFLSPLMQMYNIMSTLQQRCGSPLMHRICPLIVKSSPSLDEVGPSCQWLSECQIIKLFIWKYFIFLIWDVLLFGIEIIILAI